MRKVNCLKFSLLGVFLIFFFSDCNLMMNKKGLQKERYVYEPRFSYDDTPWLHSKVIETLFFYKNLGLIYFSTIKQDTQKANSFWQGNVYYLLDIKKEKVYKFDSLIEKPVFKPIPFQAFLVESYFSKSYQYFDTSENKSKLVKNGEKETILKVYSLKYKPSNEVIFLSKSRRNLKATLCPYFDSVYNKRAYKGIVSNQFYSNDNHFYDISSTKEISKVSFSKKERNRILSFFNGLDSTMFK